MVWLLVYDGPKESWGGYRVRVLYRIFLITSAIGLLLPVALSSGSRMESIDCWHPNYEELKPEANQPSKRAYEIFKGLVVSADFRPHPGDIG